MPRSDRPLLSTVIPTSGRPRYLPRAVESALRCEPVGACEVVVVPNGPDTSWRDSLADLLTDIRVTVAPIDVAHANVARNAGFALARGEYVRFLDDDDYLYPEVAAEQLRRLEASGAEVSSAAVDRVDELGERISILCQPRTQDLVVATLLPARTTLPTAHLFRRSALVGLSWDEQLPARQDTDWMMRLCAKREFEWCRLDSTVGAWVQHSGTRVSSGRKASFLARITSEMLLRLASILSDNGRFSDARREAAADGMWNLVQKGLMDDPDYWREMAKIAEGWAAGRHPSSRLYSIPGVGALSPLTVETMLVPLRKTRRWLTGKA